MTPIAMPTAAPVLRPFLELDDEVAELGELPPAVGVTVTVRTVPSAVTVETVGDGFVFGRR